MSNCAICQAPLPQGSSTCPYAVPEAIAPWRGDYAAMHRGDMTHLEHKIHVARWALHYPSAQTARSLSVLRELAGAHAGKLVPVYALDGAHAHGCAALNTSSER